MPKALIHILIFICCPFLVQSQDPSYVHYDTRDGLAGSTVYSLCQDRDGFIWFATEFGVSRFDGTHFKNFTVKDGLPENEVLRVYADKKGRVWIASFSNNLCYYYKNKIYNSANDSLVRKLKFKKNVYNIVEDLEGNLMFADFSMIIELKANDEVVYVTDMPFFKDLHWDQYGVNVDYIKGGFGFYNKDSIFKLVSNKLIFYDFIPKDGYYKEARVKVLPDGSGKYLRTPANRTSFGIKPYTHQLYIVNTLDGSWTFDSVTFKLKEHFLPGKIVSNTIIDVEDNLWFSTLGDGVFKLPSKNIKTIISKVPEAQKESEVFSITKAGSGIIAGKGFSKALRIRNGIVEKVIDYKGFLAKTINSSDYNRLYAIKVLSNGDVMLGFDQFLIRESRDQKIFSNLRPIKSIEQIDTDNILVGTNSYVFKVRINDLKVIDTLWSGRATKLFYHNRKYYVGHINGIIEIDEKGSRNLGNIHPSLQRRINDIVAAPDGVIWIATNDQGVVGYKDGKVLYTLNEENSLSSNICKALFLKGKFLWVGTNKGLNKIDLINKSLDLKYTTSDGLPGDIINAIYIEDSMIWLGTPEGVVSFNENKVSGTSICRLVMLDVKVSGSSQPIKNSYTLPFESNNLNFEYVAISFKSAGDIIYKYRLVGLDTTWIESRSTTLTYQSLPPGNYELQVYAINKFGVKSNVVKIALNIATPFWKTWWFYLLGALMIITIAGLLMSWRYRVIRKRLEQRNDFERQVASMEQQALQAQMNPHFIFNCLNSIQQYIITRDGAKANQYLTEFASLIRLTLDNSGKKTISVREEVEYLTRYLQMEQMRFGDNFKYTIAIADNVDADGLEIPAMLLQPYVENCLRHGIRNMREEMGVVEIQFFMYNDQLACTITDNGIGRKKASELKSARHIEYQSKGMDLTGKRIELLNKITNKIITVEVVDLTNSIGIATGTKVIIKFPV